MCYDIETPDADEPRPVCLLGFGRPNKQGRGQWTACGQTQVRGPVRGQIEEWKRRCLTRTPSLR